MKELNPHKLINKYRPENFSEIVGQKRQIEILEGVIKKGVHSSPYLFSGSSGVGKSATAMCFASAINCRRYSFEDKKICGTCESCQNKSVNNFGSSIHQYNCGMLDTSIKGLNSLKSQFMYLSPHKWNIYIFEEVHMWNVQVQTRLATILENLPDHCLLIFTTSEINEIRPFFRERCTHLKFREPSYKEILKRLRKINSIEKGEVHDTELTSIAKAHIGHVRASINSMEKLINGRRINQCMSVSDCI